MDSDDEENALVLPTRDNDQTQDLQSEANTLKSTNTLSTTSNNTKHEDGSDTQVAFINEDGSATGVGSNQQQNISSQEIQPKQENKEETTKPVESISVVANPHTNEHGSRFYIKKRVIVGNVSKFIPLGWFIIHLPIYNTINILTLHHSDKREPGLRQYTHKWMIYVTTPPGDEDIASFLSCVRYHLHPSYKPNDVIDVSKSPFHLTRLGWGEFPIRVQLHFVDSRRNKLVDVFHQLKVCISIIQRNYTLSSVFNHLLLTAR
jgi:hypothetical protein